MIPEKEFSITRQQARQFRDKLSVYVNFKDHFPITFETVTSEKDLVYLKHYVRGELHSYFQQLTLSDYKRNFFQYHKERYDMHEKNFQDFVLRETSSLKPTEFVPSSESFEMLYLKRTRNFAVASRDDLTWEGKPISDPTEKKKKKMEMDDYHLSAKLYDWCLATDEQIESLLLEDKIKSKEPKVYVYSQDTLFAVEQVHNKFGNKKIGWINLANAHNVGGAYNRSRGSQEENTITHSTAIVTLTLHADPLPENIYKWTNQNYNNYMYPFKYRQNHHIPPGGVYTCKTKLLNSEKRIDCLMIGMASADFREKTSYRQEVECNQFAVNSEEYNMRILIDLEAVCLAAIKHDIEFLILGATGCGCFNHDAKIEAMLWRKVLSKYARYFEQVIFAIFDNEGYNYKSFQVEFQSKL